MRTLLTVLVSVGLTVPSACSAPPDREPTTGNERPAITAGTFDDPEVARIHTEMMEAMAPDGAWERARYIRFDWVSERGVRTHAWDRRTGAYRLEVPGEGGTLIALFDVDEPRAGRVWIDGMGAQGEVAARALDRAHDIFVNDTYWLLMPYMWNDPMVATRYLGERTDSTGKSWEVVELIFDEAGRAPGPKYHAFVNAETWFVERWHQFADVSDEEPRMISEWTEWRQFGPIRLATERGSVSFRNIDVRPDVPRGAFDPPGSR